MVTDRRTQERNFAAFQQKSNAENYLKQRIESDRIMNNVVREMQSAGFVEVAPGMYEGHADDGDKITAIFLKHTSHLKKA